MTKVKAEFNYLVVEFGLNFVQENDSALLAGWLQKGPITLETLSEEMLAKVEPRLSAEIDGWFEEELKMKLLALILMLAELDVARKIGVFFERQITAQIGDYRISVVTDCMVSSVYGFTTPQTPYYFMQEFKKSKGDKQDPEGQMLAAMIAAQHLNQNGKPLYGSYVIGRDWFFTVLEGRDYARSNALQLTKPEELRQVILTLRKLKQIILDDLAN
jgi:hypothetical protein